MPSGRQMRQGLQPLALAGEPAAPVWGNPRSKIYHWPGCPNYPPCASAPSWQRFPSREAAQEAGYRAARNCPPSVSSTP